MYVIFFWFYCVTEIFKIFKILFLFKKKRKSRLWRLLRTKNKKTCWNWMNTCAFFSLSQISFFVRLTNMNRRRLKKKKNLIIFKRYEKKRTTLEIWVFFTDRNSCQCHWHFYQTLVLKMFCKKKVKEKVLFCFSLFFNKFC